MTHKYFKNADGSATVGLFGGSIAGRLVNAAAAPGSAPRAVRAQRHR
jgi:hypothetical protein